MAPKEQSFRKTGQKISVTQKEKLTSLTENWYFLENVAWNPQKKCAGPGVLNNMMQGSFRK